MKTPEKLFNSALKEMKYGLCRLTSDLRLVDKNEMADAVFSFPKRGSNMALCFVGGSDALSGLESSRAISVTLKADGTVRNAVAFRESDGGILILFHPLLSALYLGNNSYRFDKILSLHWRSILGLLEAADGGGIANYGVTYSPDRAFFGSFDGKDFYTVARVVPQIVGKLSQTALKKELTVLVDKKCERINSCVRFTQIEYVLGELLAIREHYGKSDKARLQIGCSDNCFMLVLVDRTHAQAGRVDEYYLKIFSELMKIIDVGTSAHISSDGELVVKAYLPFVKTSKFMQPTYAPRWDYFDYCRYYYEK